MPSFMVPEGEATQSVLTELRQLCAPGDVIVDGGNSHYKQTVARAREMAESGIDLVDSGTSGGVFGLERGYSLMIGGRVAAVDRLRPVLDTLAPPPSITITLPESLPIIHGDRIRVAQVFQNLIGNALKFHHAALAINNKRTEGFYFKNKP